MAIILDPAFGDRWSIAIYGWVFLGMWFGSMFWYAVVYMARTVSREHLMDGFVSFECLSPCGLDMPMFGFRER